MAKAKWRPPGQRQVMIEVPRVFEPLLLPSRYKAAWGGRGGAKSHFFAEQLLARCLSKPTRWACIREVQNSLRDSVRQLLVDKIEKLGLGSDFTVMESEIRGRNGSLIIFRGMQSYNAESIKSLEGFDGAWVEEAQSLSAGSLRQLRPTIRGEGSEIWFSWNPRSRFDPVDEFFRGPSPPSDAIIVKTGWRENPWLPAVLAAEKNHDYAVDAVMADHVWGGAYEVISQGSYYGSLMVEADLQGRITEVRYDPALPVWTAWDLGYGDDTAIWFAQKRGPEVRWIDYYENRGFGLDHYVRVLQSKPYIYGTHILPHDANSGDITSGKTSVQVMNQLGVRNLRALERGNVTDGINALRSMIAVSYFDKLKCEKGIEALRMYRREYDDKRACWKDQPLHDWTSHPSDAARYMAVGLPGNPPKLKVVDGYAVKKRTTGSWMTS